LQTVLADVDRLVLIVPADHALAGAPQVAFADALGFDFVTLARAASLTRKVDVAAEAAGRHLRIRIQVRSFDAMCRLVAAGMGLANLPRAGAALHGQALKLKVLELTGIDTQRRLLAATRERAVLSKAARAFVRLVEAHAATVRRQGR
jgi:DNA-binding transcriptional LysR family regulator